MLWLLVVKSQLLISFCRRWLVKILFWGWREMLQQCPRQGFSWGLGLKSPRSCNTMQNFYAKK